MAGYRAMNPYAAPPLPSEPAEPLIDWTNIVAVLSAIGFGLLGGALLQSVFQFPLGPRL
jgi:hypothetical protein